MESSGSSPPGTPETSAGFSDRGLGGGGWGGVPHANGGWLVSQLLSPMSLSLPLAGMEAPVGTEA